MKILASSISEDSKKFLASSVFPSLAISPMSLVKRNRNDIFKSNSELPEDVLDFIADTLSFEDYLNFSQISTTARKFAKEDRRHYFKPWLMLSNKPRDKTRLFYSPLEEKIFNVKLPKVVRRSWCCGSYQGWLILAHKTRGNFIYNPITKVRLRLATHEVENVCYRDYDQEDNFFQLTAYKKGEPRTCRQHMKRSPYFLSKVVLSSVPSSSSSTPLFAAAMTENHKILITSCHSGQFDRRWHQFCPITLAEEEGLLSPIVPNIWEWLEEKEKEEQNVDEDDDDDDDNADDYDTNIDEEEEAELVIEDEDDDDVNDQSQREFIFGEDDDDNEDPNIDYEEEVDLKVEGEGNRYYEMYERHITDILFYKGDLYAVNTYGKVMVLNIHDFSLRRVDKHPLKLKRNELKNLNNVYYLVESCHGELLLVVRIRDEYLYCYKDDEDYKHSALRYETTKFVVFRLDEANGEPFQWVRVENLGDQILFLGQNNSVSVLSSHIKAERNCIYFTDCLPTHYYLDYLHLTPTFYKDVGVYYLDDARIENLIPAELDLHLHTFMRQPVFFTPNPW